MRHCYKVPLCYPAAAATLCLLSAGCDFLDTAKSFDDCILNHMQGATNDKAVILINRACEEKFPKGFEEGRETRELSTSELSMLTGRAGLSFENYYAGSIYNGNEAVTVTTVTILITGNRQDISTDRQYTVPVDIPPLSAKEFGFDILLGDEGTEYSWSIFGAQGYTSDRTADGASAQ